METLPPDASLEEAAELMEERQLLRLLVVDGGKRVGIVSMGDLSREVDDTTAARTLEHISEPSGPVHRARSGEHESGFLSRHFPVR